MQVTSLESGRVETLEITDSNGVNYARDCIGNYGGFKNDITYCEETGEYVTETDEKLDFWLSFCKREQASSDAMEIVKKIGLDNDEALYSSSHLDIESGQKDFINDVKEALENNELLYRLGISEDDSKEAHAEICEILGRDCFK